MTERRIDPSNYLDLAGGREDIAVAIRQRDEAWIEAEKRNRIIEGIISTLGSLATDQLEVISSTAANMANLRLDEK